LAWFAFLRQHHRIFFTETTYERLRVAIVFTKMSANSGAQQTVPLAKLISIFISSVTTILDPGVITIQEFTNRGNDPSSENVQYWLNRSNMLACVFQTLV
jgi:hypothetical protein